MKLLMVDNYDSFTYNIVQYLGELGAEVEVFRNDEITLEGIAARAPDRLVISPGPCSPAEAGVSVAAIQHFAGRLPILGVCLGHQSIGAAFGGRIVRRRSSCMARPASSPPRRRRVRGLPRQFTVNATLAFHRARELPRGAGDHGLDDDGEIMGVRHRRCPSRACSSPREHPDRARPRHVEELPEKPDDHPQEALQRTIEHREIFHDEMLHLMRLIMSGELSP
ncbi:glutamine amidotransferase of anthranilate synthase [Alicycliphilus sp. B1]|nr:glutamine amidotransferase of anthranilate synthase [Alicycliphilus sp. B1]